MTTKKRKAWIVRHNFGVSKVQLAESSIFFLKKDAVECANTCGDGFKVIKVEIREVTNPGGRK